jgi:tetratricopeptide (TPR) repeat protein
MDKQKTREEIIYLTRQQPDLAIERANAIVDKLPDEAWTWSMRSYVYKATGDLEKALSDINKAIELNFVEPANHFYKAQYFIDLGNFQLAIESLDNAIKIGEKYGFPYYNQTSLFFRALCNCRIGNFDTAERDLQVVDDDMQMWVDRLRSKTELMDACRNGRLD